MRRILFRGKRVDNGAWETGSFVGIRIWCSDARTYIADKMTGYNTPVIPETVSQFTGLYDKNGVRIFEGDIIKANDNLIGAVEWNDTFTKYIVCYNQISGNWFDFECENGYPVALNCEIIGNIYDNPELKERCE